MIDDDIFREEVEVSLRQATDGELVRIMQFIDRLPSRARLDDVVAPMRGRLALVRPVRSLTLARVLTLPVEDLLVDPACEAISPWVLPRDALAVFHQLALDGVGADEAAVLEDEARGGAMDDRGAVLAVGRRLWPLAEAALRRFLAMVDRLPLGARPVGWKPSHGPHLARVADLLAEAEVLTGFVDRLPLRPMPHLDGEQRQAACELLRWAGTVSPPLQQGALTILLRRAADPAAVLGLLSLAECGMDPTAQVAALRAATEENLREAEVLTGAAASADISVFNAADLVLRLAALAASVEKSVGQLQDTALQQRWGAVRAAAATQIAARFAGALAGAAAAAFDSVMPGGDSRTAASDDQTASAEAAARAVGKIALAGAGLAGAALAEIAQPWREAFHLRLTAAAAQVDGDGWARLTAVMDGLRLVEIVFGPAAAAAAAAQIAPADPSPVS